MEKKPKCPFKPKKLQEKDQVNNEEEHLKTRKKTLTTNYS